MNARCALHSEAAAVDVCARCGRFVCGDCLELRDDRPLCADCANRPESRVPIRGYKGLALALVGLILMPAGLCAVLPLALLAIVVGVRDVVAIRRGRGADADLKLAHGAWICGVLLIIAGLVLTVLKLR